MAEQIPTSRVHRGAKLSKLVAHQAVRGAGVTLSGLRDTDEEHLARTERALADAAEDIVSVLGSMKGLAMKAGQLLSMFDPLTVAGGDSLPPQQRDRFRRKLAELYDQAPRVSFAGMRAVVERDHGQPLATVFAEFDSEPIGAASIGQVYRARPHDGREVAVKVQYPGIDVAIRADLKNLSLLMRMARTIAPAIADHAMYRELTTHFADEADYRAEAEHHRIVAEIYRGHPFIRIPEVVSEWCTARVLVTELIEGRRFEEITELPAAERDRVGEILVRFYIGSILRERRFTGDPHPGNILLTPGGQVAFLDFGLFKHMAATAVDFESACARAAAEYRGADLRALLVDYGVLEPDSPATADACLRLFHEVSGWLLTDADTRIAEDAAASALLAFVDPPPRLLRQPAPGIRPGRTRLRPPRRIRHAGVARKAARHRELASHCPRMALRRRAAHRTRPAGTRLAGHANHGLRQHNWLIRMVSTTIGGMGGDGARKLRALSAADSLRRLASANYGRIVYARRGTPIIRPVNHIVEEDAVVVRAHLGAGILRGDGQVVAYEVDSFDEKTRRGWSVIVTGVARVVDDPDQVRRYESLLDPWIKLPTDHVIRIETEVVTGLELVDDWS